MIPNSDIKRKLKSKNIFCRVHSLIEVLTTSISQIKSKN